MATRRPWPRHEYGQCALKMPWAFVPIPKCASTWMKNAFAGSRWVNFETDTDFPRHVYYVVVLRDPIDRWCSGLAQCHLGNRTDWELHYRTLGWDKVFDQIVFDNHTEPQISFIQKIDFDRVIWFQFGPNLERDFDRWCQGKFQPRSNLEGQTVRNALIHKPAKWPGKSLSGPEMLQEAHSVVSENPRYRQKLREFYHKDYQLYESVPFYRAG